MNKGVGSNSYYVIMKKILEDTNTLLVSLIGVVGGLIWCLNNKWGIDAIIFLSVSSVGLLSFLAIKLFGENNRPNVEIELKHSGSNRGPQMLAPGLSPQNDVGEYLQEENGIYHYEFEHKYVLIIRNNSTQNAYNVKVYVEKKYYIKFMNDDNLLDPLIVDKPKTIKAKYTFGRNLTPQQSLNELSIKFNQELQTTRFIIEYQDEHRKTYFTEFFPPTTNLHLKKKPNINNQEFRQI